MKLLARAREGERARRAELPHGAASYSAVAAKSELGLVGVFCVFPAAAVLLYTAAVFCAGVVRPPNSVSKVGAATCLSFGLQQCVGLCSSSAGRSSWDDPHSLFFKYVWSVLDLEIPTEQQPARPCLSVIRSLLAPIPPLDACRVSPVLQRRTRLLERQWSQVEEEKLPFGKKIVKEVKSKCVQIAQDYKKSRCERGRLLWLSSKQIGSALLFLVGRFARWRLFGETSPLLACVP